MLHYVDWQIVINTSQEHGLGLLHPEDRGIKFLQTVGNHLPLSMV